MKKLAFFFLLLLMATVSAKAQSGMTDNQVSITLARRKHRL